MVDLSGCGSQRNWVCPNDRHLALRAKLKTGWSVKTLQLQRYGQHPPPLDPVEKDMICSVIKRAEAMEHVEQERVGRLVERLDNMKRNAVGSGTNQCILCGDRFGMLGSAHLLCQDCKKTVCPKCGIETSTVRKETSWRCKICSETREMWKKSGAWFFKGLPKYVLPQKKHPSDGKYTINRLPFRTGERGSWSQKQQPSNDDSSSEDEQLVKEIKPSSRHDSYPQR